MSPPLSSGSPRPQGQYVQCGIDVRRQGTGRLIATLAASPTTSVVVPNLEHRILARIVCQGDDESVGRVVPDRVAIRRRHKVTLECGARSHGSEHKVRGSCGHLNPSYNLGTNMLTSGVLAWGCVPDIHAERRFIQQIPINTAATGRPIDLDSISACAPCAFAHGAITEKYLLLQTEQAAVIALFCCRYVVLRLRCACKQQGAHHRGRREGRQSSGGSSSSCRFIGPI